MKKLFNRHFEWGALSVGLLLMALMNPYTDYESSWCLFEKIGITFCPGEGLGHSIAFLARGEYMNSLEANIMGPFALIIISSRIIYLLNNKFFKRNKKSLHNG
ncbi:DUF2752 domain-containing protein [Balneolaceae bacterium YR4-1]|uniref:DUF2752 domain-containing protein n=1 Tax=Halalkalibaculum roseum TaxID=2709311 RepID=A0A6M1SWC0_9BACT|nr:DUF2752 domain-containing protein [Halalkalibaculum roseum]NGP76468.1 DUF2752 domain-containing protein [Halalkalibaculum roseum]